MAVWTGSNTDIGTCTVLHVVTVLSILQCHVLPVLLVIKLTIVVSILVVHWQATHGYGCTPHACACVYIACPAPAGPRKAWACVAAWPRTIGFASRVTVGLAQASSKGLRAGASLQCHDSVCTCTTGSLVSIHAQCHDIVLSGCVQCHVNGIAIVTQSWSSNVAACKEGSGTAGQSDFEVTVCADRHSHVLPDISASHGLAGIQRSLLC